MKVPVSAEVIFWVSLGMLAYTYAGYPLLLAIVAKLSSRLVERKEWTPSVSIIISAYNEERDLAAKLENTLALDYPASKLEIIVTSDCSTDRTDDIACSFAARGVRFHRQPERLGKTAAQNAAVNLANGEIILFSDATTHFQRDVLRKLLPSFADESVGCVTGRVIYTERIESNIAAATNSYWNYEFLLKKHESSIGSLIGVCGCMYAVRRSAYIPLYHEACSDFLIATTMVQQKLRAVYEPDAVCFEEPNTRTNQELAVRVRIITQTFADLWRNRGMLNPFKFGFFSVQLFSHKVLRYLAPLLLISLLFTSALLAWDKPLYAVLLVGQLGFYSIGLLSWAVERLGLKNSWFSLPQYFLITNLASLIAFSKLIRGERYSKWEPLRETALAARKMEPLE